MQPDKRLRKRITRTASTEITLSPKEEGQAFVEGLTSYLIGVVGTVIPPIAILSEWQSKREEVKQKHFIDALKGRLALQTSHIAQITSLLKNPKGFILFNKISFLIRATEPEEEDYGHFVDLLADILINISNKDFESLFSKTSYLISRIEKLSPQALLLLSDSDNWPKDSVGGTTMSGYTLSGDGLQLIAKGYLRDKKIANESLRPRVIHAFGELQNGGYLNFSSNKRATRTEIGEEVYKFLLK